MTVRQILAYVVGVHIHPNLRISTNLRMLILVVNQPLDNKKKKKKELKQVKVTLNDKVCCACLAAALDSFM